MIRPFTCLCLLLAAGSGLYLYQSKHQAEMLDRQIVATMKQADTARQRSGLLRAEYALLNDPGRLGDLAHNLLPTLQTTAPTQFSTLADFDRRLPAVGTPPPAAPAPLEADAPTAELPKPPVKSETPEPAKPEIAQPGPVRPPEPPRPEPSTRALVAAARPATPPPVMASLPPPRPQVAFRPPPASSPSALEMARVTPPQRMIAMRPVMEPARPAPAPAAPVFSGSLLGMARTMATPVPAAYTQQSGFGQ